MRNTLLIYMVTMLKPRLSIAPQRIAPADLTVSANKRTRGSSWMRIRARILRRDCGLCQCAECRQAGKLTPAHEVDHIVPLDMGGGDADSNLQAISVDCHKRKTAREASARAGR